MDRKLDGCLTLFHGVNMGLKHLNSRNYRIVSYRILFSKVHRKYFNNCWEQKGLTHPACSEQTSWCEMFRSKLPTSAATQICDRNGGKQIYDGVLTGSSSLEDEDASQEKQEKVLGTPPPPTKLAERQRVLFWDVSGDCPRVQYSLHLICQTMPVAERRR